MTWAETLFYVLGIVISMILIVIIAIKFSAWLERKNKEDKKDDDNSH